MVGELQTLLESTRPDFSLLPGGWEPPAELLPTLDFTLPQDQHHENRLTFRALPLRWGVGSIFQNAITAQDCSALIQLMEQSPNTEGVSVQGRKDIPDYRIGSVRTTIWSPTLAIALWKKVGNYIPPRRMTPRDATDWWQGDKERNIWYPVGFSPMLRFMRYDSGGQHYAHYDAGFIYPNDNYRTLQSVVVYLTTNVDGGATRFIEDNQNHLPIWDRDHRDWTREVQPSEVLYVSQPQMGKMLIFDHRLCHDVEMYRGSDPRIIIRGDIIFQSKPTHHWVDIDRLVVGMQ